MSNDKVSNADNVVIGYKQTLKAIQKGIVIEVLVAEDADLHLVNGILEAAAQNNIPIKKVESMKQLGEAYGIQVGASTIGIVS